MAAPPILVANAVDRGQRLLADWRGRRPLFCCVLAHTDTCLIPGVSAAGVSAALRPLTPAADAEVVLAGLPRCLPRLPSNPLGGAGPSGITRAAVQLAQIETLFVGVGLKVWPAVACRRLAGAPGRSIESGQAVRSAQTLFAAGEQLGGELAARAGRSGYLVLGESVPGGTTTALGLLLALGFDAEGRISGSLPGNAHQLKARLAHAGLQAAGLDVGAARADPLVGVHAVGDPMQPVVAGAALGARRQGCAVLLAGGCQMLAVAALMAALEGDAALDGVALGTTRWVVHDPAADIVGLARAVSADLPVLAINLDFSQSPHAGLRAYETFMVKEGVGAGGACIAALLATGAELAELHAAIDQAYDGLLAGASLTLDAPA